MLRGKNEQRLLIPCLFRKFADFGQNSRFFAKNSKYTCISSLLFANRPARILFPHRSDRGFRTAGAAKVKILPQRSAETPWNVVPGQSVRTSYSGQSKSGDVHGRHSRR